MPINMNLIYYRNKCIACGACLILSSDFWTMNNNDGKVDLIDSKEKNNTFTRKLWHDEEGLANEFENACPTKAIKIIKK